MLWNYAGRAALSFADDGPLGGARHDVQRSDERILIG